MELAARPLELAAGPLELAAAELPAAEVLMENEASSPPPALSKRSEPPGSDVEATAESAVTGKVLVATGIIKAVGLRAKRPRTALGVVRKVNFG